MKSPKTSDPRVAILRLLFSTPTRVRRNPDFIRAIRKIFLAQTVDERDSALKELNVWSLRKQIEVETEGAEDAAKGFAQVLLATHPDVSEHPARVHHLGALSPLAPLPATRWDYGRLLLRTLLEMKLQQPGLGLGSSNFALSHGKAPLSGLEIAQTWALLGGYGHLFGTFATERALLFILDSSPSLEQEFLGSLAQEVRHPADLVVRQRDMYRFFYVLAAWRVSRWPGSAARTTCLHALVPLLEPRNDVGWKRLLWAFRRARQIAYTRLHSMLGVHIASTPIPISTAVRDLRPVSQIAFLDENVEPPGAVASLIDALDRFYGEVFFTAPDASKRVLEHLREFKLWWQESRGTLADKIEALMIGPTDWPTPMMSSRAHFVRLHVPDSGTGWMNEARHWLAARKDIWREGNFLITPSRRREAECNVVDIYVNGVPHPRLVAHVAEVLAERNEMTWAAAQSTDVNRRLWRSIAAFAMKLFQLLLRQGRQAHLEPVAAEDGIGLAIAARSVVSGCGRLLGFAGRLHDTDRRTELDALREVSLQHQDRAGVWVAFLGRLRILDERTGLPLHELDAVFALIDPEKVEWHFLEHKSGASAGMRGQLNDLAEHLTVVVPPCDFVNVARGKAAHTMLTWRGDGDL